MILKQGASVLVLGFFVGACGGADPSSGTVDPEPNNAAAPAAEATRVTSAPFLSPAEILAKGLAVENVDLRAARQAPGSVKSRVVTPSSPTVKLKAPLEEYVP